MPCARSRPGPGRPPRRQPPQHICTLCHKKFSTSGHLKRHVNIHTGARNFPCPIIGCETRCTRADNLQQHIRTHSPSYVPRKAKGAARKPRTQAVAWDESRDAASSYASVASSPSSFATLDDLTTSSSQSQSSVDERSLPLTPLPSQSRPLAIGNDTLQSIELYRPKRHPPPVGAIELATGTVAPSALFQRDAVPCPQPRGTFRLELEVELVHPIPRASQPRSPLLDMDGEDAEDMLAQDVFVPSATSTSARLSPLNLGTSVPTYVQAPVAPVEGLFYAFTMENTCNATYPLPAPAPARPPPIIRTQPPEHFSMALNSEGAVAAVYVPYLDSVLYQQHYPYAYA